MQLHLQRLWLIAGFVFLIALTACTTNSSSELKYENILMPQPIPGTGWNTARAKEPHLTRILWKKENEKLQLVIMHIKKQLPPESFRAVADDNAREHLTTAFESKTVSEGLVNNYPMLLWETSATLKNGTNVTTLNLYIKGDDAAYSVNRTWFTATVSNDEKRTWIDYLRSVKVVDNRYPEHVGPKMQKIDGSAIPSPSR